MTRLLDCVALSSDHSPKFIEFWPFVAEAWQRLFGVETKLAVVGPAEMFHMKQLREYGEVLHLPPVPGISLSNQAKMARYFLAAQQIEGKVTMINDMDLLPLQRVYLVDLLIDRPAGYLFTLGEELYVNSEKGKATAGYLTAETEVWRKLFNPKNLSWEDFVRSFIGLRTHDAKEDISSTIHHEDPDTFSDESVLRHLRSIRPVPSFAVPRGFANYTDRAVCRSAWKIDPVKLANGTYVEAHLLRPYSAHAAAIKPLLDHLSKQ